ncbi:hypothetical protein ACE7GA_24475 [Roseomonas sp. CCTCC AB2023176]|uniref:hypothetical protein n=1 Tax=Roseomonas sp. CCTCC AB2023176 TaxID=3342640 RepID=UPI0035E39411
MNTIANHLIAGAMLAVAGFSGGVALSQGNVVPRLAEVVRPLPPVAAALGCAGVDAAEEVGHRIVLRYAATADEDAWCLLR